MPLLPEPTIEDLELHFFGAGNWEYYDHFLARQHQHFPVAVQFIEEGEWGNQDVMLVKDERIFTVDDFINGIQEYAKLLPDRNYFDLLEDMDAADVDAIIQIMFWGEIRLS